MPYALLVDDDPGGLRSLARWVEAEGFDVRTADSLETARAVLDGQPPDVVLLDLYLPDGTGLDLLEDLRGVPDTEVVFMTGQGSIRSAVEAMRGGAVDYLTKPVDLERLRKILGHVGRNADLRLEIDTLRGQLRRLGRFGRIIGASKAMQTVYDRIERVAPTDTTILITGETGTGKEVAARTLHELSRRSKKAFLAINCGAVAPTLIESEFFGHEKGSFTGAQERRPGIFERADGGTLFLDEITEMSTELQVKLLRVLEAGEVTRIGGTSAKSVDVRLISASNRDPEEAVAEGKLREDLLYRLNVFPVEMPPLRARDEDVNLLAQAFLDQLNANTDLPKRFSPEAMAQLARHDWPGNVRELKNAVERAWIMGGETIQAEDVPLGRRLRISHEGKRVTVDVGTSLDESEKALILATLNQLSGNKREAAAMLGVSLKTLYNRLKEYELEAASRVEVRGEETRKAPAG